MDCIVALMIRQSHSPPSRFIKPMTRGSTTTKIDLIAQISLRAAGLVVRLRVQPWRSTIDASETALLMLRTRKPRRARGDQTMGCLGPSALVMRCDEPTRRAGCDCLIHECTMQS